MRWWWLSCTRFKHPAIVVPARNPVDAGAQAWAKAGGTSAGIALSVARASSSARPERKELPGAEFGHLQQGVDPARWG